MSSSKRSLNAGSPGIRPAPNLPPGPRAALIIAAAEYTDPELKKLRAPADDAQGLAEVLGDPAIGGFDVTTVLNADERETRRAITGFLARHGPEATVLVYLSCHGLLDKRNRLYFAATDTLKTDLSATGIAAPWLTERLDEDCRARQQIIILDCCFSASFANGSKGDGDLVLERSLPAHGRGRVVLTASRGNEYSFEGDAVSGPAIKGSVFTFGLIDGLRSGKADKSGRGHVTVDDAYDYTCRYVRSVDARQTPTRWLSGGEGSIVLARNPVGTLVTPAPLPDDLVEPLHSRYPEVRSGAVQVLGQWLAGDDPARILAAEQHLREIADMDIPLVASEAKKSLEAAPETGVPAYATAIESDFAVPEDQIRDTGAAREERAELPYEESAAAAPEKREQSAGGRARARSVRVIREHQLIPDGAKMTLELESVVKPGVVQQVSEWMAEDPVRGQVWWSSHSDRDRPLRWAVEPGKAWNPTRLRDEIFRRAGISAPSFSAADAWCYEGRCLYEIANSPFENS